MQRIILALGLSAALVSGAQAQFTAVSSPPQPKFFVQPKLLFQAHRSANYHNPDNTKIDFTADVVEVDTHAAYDQGTHRFVPQVAGWYEVGMNVTWLLDARLIDDADISAAIHVNGVQVADFHGVAYNSPLPTWDFTVNGDLLIHLDGDDDAVSWHTYHSSWDADGGEVSGSRSLVSARLVARETGGVAFQASRSSNYLNADNTAVDFEADQVHVDTHAGYDVLTHRFQPTVRGWYDVGVNITWLMDARLIDDADISAIIRRNGIQVTDFHGVFYSSPLPTWDFTVRGRQLIHLDGQGDYLTWHTYHSSWDADAGTVSGPRSHVSAVLVARE